MSKARVIFTSYVTHYAIFSNICHLVVSHTRNTTAQQIGVPEVEQGIAWVEWRLFLAPASKSKHRFRYFERGGIVVGHVPGHIGVESVYECKVRRQRVPLQLSLVTEDDVASYSWHFFKLGILGNESMDLDSLMTSSTLVLESGIW